MLVTEPLHSSSCSSACACPDACSRHTCSSAMWEPQQCNTTQQHGTSMDMKLSHSLCVSLQIVPTWLSNLRHLGSNKQRCHVLVCHTRGGQLNLHGPSENVHISLHAQCQKLIQNTAACRQGYHNQLCVGQLILQGTAYSASSRNCVGQCHHTCRLHCTW